MGTHAGYHTCNCMPLSLWTGPALALHYGSIGELLYDPDRHKQLRHSACNCLQAMLFEGCRPSLPCVAVHDHQVQAKTAAVVLSNGVVPHCTCKWLTSIDELLPWRQQVWTAACHLLHSSVLTYDLLLDLTPLCRLPHSCLQQLLQWLAQRGWQSCQPAPNSLYRDASTVHGGHRKPKPSALAIASCRRFCRASKDSYCGSSR